MRGVVPEQVVGPASRLAERVHVGAAEEIGLHVHLLDMELPRQDAFVDELVARIEPPRVADHGHEARCRLHRRDRLGVLEAVGQRDLDLHVLAGLEALDRLGGVHLGGRRQNHRVEAGKLQRLGKLGRRVADAIFFGRLLRLVEFAPDERDHLDPVDPLDAVEMLEAEGAGARKRDFDGVRHENSSA